MGRNKKTKDELLRASLKRNLEKISNRSRNALDVFDVETQNWNACQNWVAAADMQPAEHAYLQSKSALAHRLAYLEAQVQKLKDQLKDSERRANQDVFVGVQEGGSSAEWYANTFNTLTDFHNAVVEWDEASYGCVGPYAVRLGLEGDWLDAINQILRDAMLRNFAVPNQTKEG
jgi:hypothetical protein